MDIVLSKEERAFAEQMRTFFTTEIPSEIRERLAHGGHPSREDIVTSQRIMNEHGLAVPHWPTEWGGQDWTPVQRHLWSEEMLLAHAPAPLSFNTQMIGPVIATFGSPELKERFLPKTANLDIWWCQGFSEPNAGSDLASLKTTAVREGDEYVVNGQKTWTTLGQYADWIFCLVRTDPEVKKQRGISMLLVDMATPGVTVRPIHLIDGGYEVNEVFFDNVRVPVDNLVGEENSGWDQAKFLLGNERTGVVAVGQTKARIKRIKQVAAETRSNGRALIDDPLFRARLTKLEIELTAIEMSVLRVLDGERRRGPGTPDPVSSVLKFKGSELQQEATELLVDVLGPAGLAYRESTDVPDGFAALPDGAVDALPTYFNWRKASIYSGSNEVQRTIIAKQILKF
ncbi:Acyl-CoA dehydrogenase [Jatrophihabitans endophyticus]|uniref:Acyl-CoA dehydrogenase n=1 Tax=Jatrophihabitans endophyticus TaxID=1206085 RepID=A0A1M5IVI9_9ACTN|nr:acyl-CoA dehydrogenase family protein [Jatrophihabitans endophyticus]SHG32314.1 Acyl-CoA dehydrogenase [Jatrophihabitans endophyticus]